MAGRFKESCRKGKDREAVTPQLGDGDKCEQHFQQQTEGGESVAKEAEHEADEEGSDNQEYDITRTITAPPGPLADSSSEESNRESHRPRSLPRLTEPTKLTRRYFKREISPDEQAWESLTTGIAYSRTDKKSQAVKGI